MPLLRIAVLHFVALLLCAAPAPLNLSADAPAHVPVPPDLRQQTAAESQYLDLHKCLNANEAFAGAFLTSTDHLLMTKTDYNLSFAYCEMATFILMSSPRTEKIDDSPAHGGVVIQTLDVLDFSVVHLSAYERSLRLYKKPKDSLVVVKEAARAIRVRATAAIKQRKAGIFPEQQQKQALRGPATVKSGVDVRRGKVNPEDVLNKQRRTVAIMPFLGTDKGAGSSDLGNRYFYLQACVWSLAAHFDHVAVFVNSKEDHDYISHLSVLPVFQVHVLEGVRGAALPVAAIQTTKRMLLSAEWDFDFIYYTESDQILVARDWSVPYGHLQHYRRRMIIPHRLMAYPAQVLMEGHLKGAAKEMFHSSRPDLVPANKPNAARDAAYAADDEVLSYYRCCLPRQNCKDQSSWVPLRDFNVPVVRMDGLLVPLGNTNFHQETYRACTLMRIPDSPPAPASSQSPTELIFVDDTTGGSLLPSAPPTAETANTEEPQETAAAGSHTD